ncbi:5845_t:CDS:2, partial [Cetraspora pellucida]
GTLPITSYFPSSEISIKTSSTQNIIQKKKSKPSVSWVWKYTRRDKITKVKYCDVHIDNDDGTSKRCPAIFMPKTSTTNIAAHLRTEHRIFKNQKWKAQPSVLSTTIPIPTTQQTIETVIQNHMENASPLPEQQQNHITYRLVAWIVEEMMPLNFPCNNTIKNIIKESVLYTNANLSEMMRQTMVSVCLTTDLWTQNHIPYIGITAHWLSETFTMYQFLITIEHFAYPHTGDRIEDFLREALSKWNIFDKVQAVTTDNAALIIKAIRQLGTTHLGCTAHTIHLAVTDGLKKCETLIRLAKSLNNFLVNRDKYQSLFRKIQCEPISSDTATRWNSTYLVLQQLLELRESVLKFAKNLINDPDRTVRADGNSLNDKMLSDEEWTGLKELYQILQPFARALTFVGGNQYPTLSMMYHTIRHLFKSLDQIEDKLTNIEVIEMHQSLHKSMVSRWNNPEIELRKRIELSHHTSNLPTTDKVSDMEMSSFFDDGVEPSSLTPINTELQMYISIPQIPKYDPKDLRYEK